MDWTQPLSVEFRFDPCPYHSLSTTKYGPKIKVLFSLEESNVPPIWEIRFGGKKHKWQIQFCCDLRTILDGTHGSLLMGFRDSLSRN